jgi:hypothetical protein
MPAAHALLSCIAVMQNQRVRPAAIHADTVFPVCPAPWCIMVTRTCMVIGMALPATCTPEAHLPGCQTPQWSQTQAHLGMGTA